MRAIGEREEATKKKLHLHKLHGARRGCSEENNKKIKHKSYVVRTERERAGLRRGEGGNCRRKT